MRRPERAASNGYDLGRDAPFGIVRLPAHLSWLGKRKRRPQPAPLFLSAASGPAGEPRYDASASAGTSDLEGGKALSP
jgi:hypothetical protein